MSEFTGTCSKHRITVCGDDKCPACEREALADVIASRLAPSIHLPPMPKSRDYDLNSDYRHALAVWQMVAERFADALGRRVVAWTEKS